MINMEDIVVFLAFKVFNVEISLMPQRDKTIEQNYLSLSLVLDHDKILKDNQLYSRGSV